MLSLHDHHRSVVILVRAKRPVKPKQVFVATMAPLDIWYKWLQKHQKGEEVISFSKQLIPMRKLYVKWNAIPYNDKDSRATFIVDHVVPFLHAKRTRVDQPKVRSGHDTLHVSRSVVITKKFKTTVKYKATKDILRMTKGCFCTPGMIAYNDEENVIVEEDMGKTVGEDGTRLKAKEKQSLIDHLRHDHSVVVQDRMVSFGHRANTLFGDRLCSAVVPVVF